MPKRPLVLAMAAMLVVAATSSCLPSVVSTEHDNVLITTAADGTLVIVADDDPLQQRFEDEVLSDPYVAYLLLLYEHATEAFIATNRMTSLNQTIANKPMIVLDSQEPGVLRRIKVTANEERVSVELALGLGHNGEIDLARARNDAPRAMARLLLELMGLRPEETDAARPLVHEVTEPTTAFWTGFGAALDAEYGQHHPELSAILRQELQRATGGDANPAPGAESERMLAIRDRLRRYELVPINGLRARFEDGERTSTPRPYADAVRTPGVVATFFVRLVRVAGDYYPQRHMLWFANYDGPETPYAKILLAGNQMSRRRAPDVEAFVAAYAEAFPAQRDEVVSLAREVFGDPAE